MRISQSLSEIVSLLPTPAFVLQNGFIHAANPAMAYMIDSTTKDLGNFPMLNLIHPEDKLKFNDSVLHGFAGNQVRDLELKLVTRNGRKLIILCSLALIDFNQQPALLGQMTDITDLKRVTETILGSNQKYSEILDSLQDVVFETDLAGNLNYVNRRGFDFFGYTQEDFNRGFNILQTLPPEDLLKARENLSKLFSGEYLGATEYNMLRTDGTLIPVIIHSVPLFQSGQPIGMRGTIIDISERKQTEEKMRFLSMHDNLTGLYNRAYFEHTLVSLQQQEAFPLAIIVCDIDGLKLINDTLGHDQGDLLLKATTRLISKALRNQDILARIGGDEFAILLPLCTKKEAERLCNRIRNRIALYNEKNPELLISLSLGYCSSETCSNLEAMFREADNNMYREKLYRKQSTRSSIVTTLAKMLDARDYITEGHADRLEHLVVSLARKMNYPHHILNNLRLFAYFHDIGKVGVPDNVLFKPGPFTPDELLIMQKHSEIGYRIAMSAQDLIPISEWILHHHEWWNGEGYPLGLQGEKIPLECRILAIADAFDAMTNDRPYRKAMTPPAAMVEIEKCAGTQFDPFLVKKFIKAMKVLSN